MSKKARKNSNALTHGVYSRKAMLPGEKFADYEALRAEYYEEWSPEGITERSLVDDVVTLRWKQQRMDRYDQVLLQQRSAEIEQECEDNRHRMNLKNLEPEFTAAPEVKAVEAMLSRLSSLYSDVIISWVSLEGCKDPATWGRDIGQYLSSLQPTDPLEESARFLALVDPELMDAEISRSMRLGEAIDRKLKRLMQVKTAKQIFPSMRKNANPQPKLINPPTDANPKLPTVLDQETAINSVVKLPAETDARESRAALQKAIVIEVAPIDECASTSISREDVSEKEHSGRDRAIVENFADPTLPTGSEMQRFSTLCDKLREQAGYPRKGLAASV